MRITVTGATGFLGRRFVKSLGAAGHRVHILSRRPDPGLGLPASVWDPLQGEPPEESLEDCEAIVHLMGEPVAQRWTEQAKRRIRESRVVSTRRLVQALSTRSRRPSVLVCASAIGYYGSRGGEILTEESGPGRGFLPEVCVEWEREAGLAEALGMRVVKVRTGIVLGKEGGMLEKVVPIFRLGLGGRIAGGKQWMSWISADDLVALMQFSVEKPLSGAVNGVAPAPVTNSEFTANLAAALHRPAPFPVPALALKLAYGSMAEVIVASQRVLPGAARAAGFEFSQPTLDSALRLAIS